MRRLVRRLVDLAVVLVAVSALTFALLSLLPGGPAVAILGSGANPASIAKVNAELGLDRPLPVRYARWLGHALTGDLGRSYRSRLPVAKLVRGAIVPSLELVVLAQVLALLVAVPVALRAARRPGRRLDRAMNATAIAAIGLPQFALGIVLLAVFAVKLRWFPAANYTPIDEGILPNLRSLFLPALTLAVPVGGVYARLLRAEIGVTLAQDHVMMARAMGLSERRVLTRHVLRPSSLTLLAIVGLNTGVLLGGAVLVETLFSVPGVGRMLVEAVLTKDYLVVQGVTLTIAATFVLANAAADLATIMLDPRLRLETRHGR
jgi:peptide/nickel transport system permease protein